MSCFFRGFATRQRKRDDFDRSPQWRAHDAPSRVNAERSCLWHAPGLQLQIVTDPDGRPIAEPEWRRRERDWLPSAEDRAFVTSLMQRVTEPGKVAGWIAPPEIGINNTPLDYEYVRLN